MSSINSSGFKYRMDSLNIDQSSLIVAYDFVSGSQFSNGYLNNPDWASGSVFSGKINGGASSFYKNYGSGFFNGSNSVSISGSIPSDGFSFLFCYEKNRLGEEILLSSAAGNSFASSSGLSLGVNDANKLFLEYWSPINGKNSVNFDRNISSKNLVFLNKKFGEFQIGIFDPVESDLFFASAPVQENSYSHSDIFTIGSGRQTFWTAARSFSGFFDDFYCLTGSQPNDYLINLFSGFYSIPVSGEVSGVLQVCQDVSVLSGSGVILGSGVTGYETVVTYTTGTVPTGCFNSGLSYVIGTGITGYEEKYMGMQEDACGVMVPIYIRTPLTGNIYATGNTIACTGSTQVVTASYNNIELTGFLTGQVFVPVMSGICYDTTGYYPDYTEIDSSFVSSLGFDSVYSLKPNSEIEHCESFFYTGKFYNNINLRPFYNSITGDWILSSSAHGGSGKNLFFNNGQLMLESGWSSYQDFGSTKYNIIGNIFLDGSVIRSNGYASDLDTVIYDNSSGIEYEARALPTGLSSSANFNSLFSSTYPNYSLFLNGVKLLSGVDYSSSNFVFNIPSSSVLIKVNNNYISSGYVYSSGSENLYRLNGSGMFANNCSQFYVNGLRQLVDYDYLELSKFSLFTGSPIVPTNKNQLVYSFSEDFWNI